MVNANEMTMGAVERETSGEEEETKLAKQLVNPISSLISVPFQANEDFGYGPSHNGYKFTLNIQPVIPISLTKNWNLILRTIVPVVSQHDLFFVENVPKRFRPSSGGHLVLTGGSARLFFIQPELTRSSAPAHSRSDPPW